MGIQILDHLTRGLSIVVTCCKGTKRLWSCCWTLWNCFGGGICSYIALFSALPVQLFTRKEMRIGSPSGTEAIGDTHTWRSSGQ